MKNITLRVENEVGLHARPAAVFVKQVSQFKSEITIRNLTTGSSWANAKSILSVLALGVEMGHEIELQASGPDEEQAIESLTELVRSGLGEKKASA